MAFKVGPARSLGWAPDVNGWFLITTLGPNWRLLYVDPHGRPGVLFRGSGNWAPDTYPSPDGRHLAFSEQSFSSNVWLLEHF